VTSDTFSLEVSPHPRHLATNEANSELANFAISPLADNAVRRGTIFQRCSQLIKLFLIVDIFFLILKPNNIVSLTLVNGDDKRFIDINKEATN
jgi:hypothetical protein